MSTPQKWQKVCGNCKFWQNATSFQYDCTFNGRRGSCKQFESKFSKSPSLHAMASDLSRYIEQSFLNQDMEAHIATSASNIKGHPSEKM